MFGYDRKQQEKIEKLYEKEKIWYPDHVMHTFLMWLLTSISMIILLFPYQAYAHDHSFYPTLIYMYALYNWGIQIYAGKYSLVRQNGKTHPIEELLCYVPVSKRQIILYRIKKVQKPVIRLALFNLLVKCFLSCVIYHSISVFDIILPVLFLLFFLCFLFFVIFFFGIDIPDGCLIGRACLDGIYGFDRCQHGVIHVVVAMLSVTA